MVPKRHKNVILCLASFFFYAWGEPRYCILLFAYSLIAYISSKCLEVIPKDRALRKYVLAASITIFACGLFYFKYAVFAWENINLLLGGRLGALQIVLPIGISFYTFQVISYVIDVYCGKMVAEKSFLTFLTYLSMFPQLIAGPIVRYEEVFDDLHKRVLTREKIADGIKHFVIGLAKKVLLADELGQMVSAISAMNIDNPIAYWLSAIGFMLQIYFDFSGYSDMAIGMGKMLGFSFPENFQYPFIARSISEFWRRWHMTLSRFLRDYLYIPLGGNRVSYGRWIINILIVWAASGIWHGAGWNFLLWGIYFGVCLIVEKKLTNNYQKKLPVIAQHAYTLVLLVISFVIFGHDKLSDVVMNLGGMLRLWKWREQHPAILFMVKNHAMLLLAAILASTPFYQRIRLLMNKDNVICAIGDAFEVVWYLLCFILSTAYLINHSFHPFLYFRF